MTTPHPPRLDGYRVETLIGSGGSADVWAATAADGAPVALKVFRDETDSGRAEWRSMHRHAGPHVVAAVDLLRDGQGRAVLVMDRLEGGSLWDVVIGRGGLTAGECVTALAPIAGALSGIHDAGSVHGDVTARNILFTAQGRPALSDLGASRPVALPGAAEWGSAGFLAPEVLDGQAPTAAADVYSLGAVAWFALVGEAPGPAALRPHLRDIVQVPAGLEALVLACLSTTPSARPLSSDLARRLLSTENPVAVPVDTVSRERAGGDDMSLTRRLRDDAQRKQHEITRGSRRKARDAGGKSRARPSTSARAGLQGVRRPVLAAGAVGAALVTAALAWPMGPGQDGEAPRAASPVAASAGEARPTATADEGTRREPVAPSGSGTTTAAVPGATRPSDVRATTARQVSSLLACRAGAWNARDASRLTRCLASASPALRADAAALASARAQGISYAGVDYRVEEVDGVLGGRLSATIVRGAYEQRRRGEVTRVAAQRSVVDLTATRAEGGWRISAWSPR